MMASAREELPGFRRAMRLFEQFHAYAPHDAGKFADSVKIPREVYYAGPCLWITYKSDKWNEGLHDYIHEIESYPHVSVGLVKTDTGRVRRLPRRICDNVTLVQIHPQALGFAYRDLDGKKVEAKAGRYEWYWHPQGKALLLIGGRRSLEVVIWGGKLDFKPQGLVG